MTKHKKTQSKKSPTARNASRSRRSAPARKPAVSANRKPSATCSEPLIRQTPAKQVEQVKKRVLQPVPPKGVAPSLEAITGSYSKKWSVLMGEWLTSAVDGGLEINGVDTSERATALIEALMGTAPKDEFEGMCAAQLIAAHATVMRCFRVSANPNNSVEVKDIYLKQAGKLMRSFAVVLDTLNRHRGKGQQKMTVEHIYVADGGQAIIGNIPSREGVSKENGRQPVAHAENLGIADARLGAMPGPLQANLEAVPRASS